MDEKDKIIERHKRALKHNKLWLVYNLGMDNGERFWSPDRAYHDQEFARLKCQQLNVKAEEDNTEGNSAHWLCQEITLMSD